MDKCLIYITVSNKCMEEAKAIMGILLISVVAASSYFVMESRADAAAFSESYVACCCNILATDGQQVFVRNQIQTFAGDCTIACRYYQDAVVGDTGRVFPQEGLCAANP